jgi:predicted CXXCH cytochrome family protein
LKCHYEGYVAGGTTWTWSGHANGSQTLELRTADSANPPYTAACNPPTNCISIPRRSTNVDADGTDDIHTHCLTCHDGGGTTAPYQLGSSPQNPPDIVPGASSWTGGIGHGFNGVNGLSFERTPDNAGPPAYDCGACHSSTKRVSDDTAVAKPLPTYHASVNLKLVANTTSYATPEYDTVAEKNSWCLSRCHRTDGGSAGKDNNPDNSISKDNNVIDHTWAPNAAEAADQTDCPLSGDPNAGLCETHPSYETIAVNALYQVPASLPIDGNTFTCGTCHEPHGNSTATPGGQMIRMNFSDGTLCDECHK